jgi:biopolymer transport protein ExbB/TolQ
MAHDFSLLRVMLNGGWAVALLLGLSVLALGILIDRWRAFSRAGRDRVELLKSLEPHWGGKNLPECLQTCERDGSIAALSVAAGIRAKIHKTGEPHAAMEREAKALLLNLETRLALLGTLGNLSPYVGLFGTVLGIIRAFRDLALASSGGAAVVSQGIAEALVSTAVGLFVAVVASASYNLFQSRLEKLAREAELVMDEAAERLNP